MPARSRDGGRAGGAGEGAEGDGVSADTEMFERAGGAADVDADSDDAEYDAEWVELGVAPPPEAKVLTDPREAGVSNKSPRRAGRCALGFTGTRCLSDSGGVGGIAVRAGAGVERASWAR